MKFTLFWLFLPAVLEGVQKADYYSFDYHEPYRENLSFEPIEIPLPKTPPKAISSSPQNTQEIPKKAKTLPSNFPKTTLPPITAKPSVNVQPGLRETPRFIEEKYLSALTDSAIAERVLSGSGIAEKDREILGFLSLKRGEVEDRVFGENEKAWDWKFDFSRDEFKLPDRVLKENRVTKWKRILALLRSLDFAASDKNANKDLPLITNPPILN